VTGFAFSEASHRVNRYGHCVAVVHFRFTVADGVVVMVIGTPPGPLNASDPVKLTVHESNEGGTAVGLQLPSAAVHVTVSVADGDTDPAI